MGRPRQTHCKRGHPLSGHNLRVERDGSRFCRVCKNTRTRARRKEHPETQAYRTDPAYVERERERLRRRRFTPAYTDDQRQRQLHSYGLSLNEYDEMLEQQNGVCALCGKTETRRRPARDGRISRLAVDHDHEMGEVRGLLCWQCNFKLGRLENNVTWLKRAIIYARLLGLPRLLTTQENDGGT